MAKFNRAKVTTIAFGHFAHDIFSSFLAPLLPLLVDKVGISLSQAGFLDIARRLPSLFNPFFGLMAENMGAKYFVILTPAVTAISMGFVGIANSYLTLLLLLFTAGISAALFHVPSPVMIKESSGDKVGKGMSYFMVGGESARTLGPLIITAAISMWGLEGTLKVAPFGIVASLILYIKLKDFKFQSTLSKKPSKGDTKEFLKKYYRFFTFTGLFILFQSAFKSALVLYLPVYLVKSGESIFYAGISLSVLQFFGILGTMFSGSYSDKIGRFKMLLISSVVTAVFMLLFVNFHSTLLFPILAVLGFFLFASGPVLMASVQDLNSTMPTFANSLYMTVNFGTSSISVFMLGVLGDRFGLDTTYQIATISSFLTILIVLMFRKIS
jgi:FSR family fosmidomycin resistance protein-like MFS transporter